MRSYVLCERNGGLGTFCIYEADRPEAIRAHAQTADPPVDEVIPIGDTLAVRPDPSPVAASRVSQSASTPPVGGAHARRYVPFGATWTQQPLVWRQLPPGPRHCQQSSVFGQQVPRQAVPRWPVSGQHI
jgi:hypothetical protein